MAGKVDRSGPWLPGWGTTGLELERRKFIDQLEKEENYTKQQILYSADLHAKESRVIADTAIYRMIMKESEQE